MQKYTPLKTIITAMALAIATPTIASAVEETLDPIFITTKGQVLQSRDVPASVTIITAEQIKQTPARDILDVIRLTTGITVSGRGVGNREVINIRGMESRHTLIMVDGRRVSASDNVIGHSDFENSWVPLEAIERIEIVRGPLSSLHGSDAMGGVINIITKQAQGKWQSTVSIMAGKRTDDRGGAEKSIAFSTRGALSENLDLTITGELADQQATPEKDSPRLSEMEGKEIKSLNFALDYQINKQHSVELFHGRVYEDRVRDTRSRGRNPVYHQSTQELERIMTSLEHKGTFAVADTNLRIYESSIDSKNTRTLGQRPNSPQKLIDRIIDGTINMPIGEQHFITLEAELRNETLEHRMMQGGTETLTNKAIFLQNQIDLTDNTLLTLGLRADDPEMFATQLSKRIYLIHHLTDTISIKGGYGEGFMAPTLKEISPNYRFTGHHIFVGNPNVKPETSNTIELGVQYNDNNLAGGVTLFRTNVDDLMVWKIISPPAPRGTPVTRHRINVDKTSIKGVEINLSAKLLAGFNTNLNLTKLNTEDRTTGLSLLQRPELTANIQIGWVNPDNSLAININGQHVGEQDATSGWRNPVRHTLPSYNLLSLNLQKSINNSLTLRTGVENLTNVRLADQHDEYEFEIRGRFIYVGADISF